MLGVGNSSLGFAKRGRESSKDRPSNNCAGLFLLESGVLRIASIPFQNSSLTAPHFFLQDSGIEKILPLVL